MTRRRKPTNFSIVEDTILTYVDDLKDVSSKN